MGSYPSWAAEKGSLHLGATESHIKRVPGSLAFWKSFPLGHRIHPALQGEDVKIAFKRKIPLT